MGYLRVSLSDEWDHGERPKAVDVTARDGETVRYVPERTCLYVGDEISGGCSECRGWLDPACAYCPSCGARVIEEDA